MSHPSVELFKQFVRKHPGLIKEVRSGNRSWQELYEEWYILGADDEMWKAYRQNNRKKEVEKSKDGLPQFFAKITELDYNRVQENIAQMNGLVTSIQQLVQDFRPKSPPPRFPQHPFYFR